MTGLIDGKSALITGAGSGIGRTTALAFAGEGASVVVADIDEKGGADTVRAIEDFGGTAHFVSVDVTNSDSVEAMVANAVSRFGRLDCAFNNAGIVTGFGHLADVEEQDFDQVMSVNVKGVWLCMKFEVRQMLAQGGGAIVNSGSIGSFSGLSIGRSHQIGSAPYITSKHSVAGLTRYGACDYAKDNIRINAVCPASVRTAMYDAWTAGNPEAKRDSENMQPMGRIAEPEDVAEAVLWLCSDKSGFVTGHMLAVDGGYGAA